MNGQDVEIIELQKYLGTMIDNKRSFDCNTNILCKTQLAVPFLYEEVD